MNSELVTKVSFRRNIIAGFLGNACGPILNFIFVPFYLHYIGTEGYALIGFFASLQIILSFLDSGLSITLNKELATLSAIPGSESRMRNIVRTLGSIYWLLAFTVGLLCILVSPYLATNWVKPTELSVDAIKKAFMLLSVATIFQFPSGFYGGGLLGMHRQLTYNILRIVFAFLRSGGALCVLVFYSPTVVAFFSWILIVSVIQAIAFRSALWYYLPGKEIKAVFDKLELRKIWKFATGITSITIIAALLTQVDKLILSKSFLLQEMGYYTLTQSIAAVLASFIIPPFTQTLFPQFSTLATTNKIELRDLYLLNCRRISYIIMPISIFLCFFSYRLLVIYTKNENLASHSYMIFFFFIIGAMINATLHLPYNLALAFGFTRRIAKLYFYLLLIYVPLLYLSLLTHKIENAAIAYLLCQLSYLCLLIPIVQKGTKVLTLKQWYWQVIIKPVITAAVLILPICFFVVSLNLVKTDFSFIIFSCVIMGLSYLAIEKFYNLFGVFKKIQAPSL